jgi:hypothetical protein
VEFATIAIGLALVAIGLEGYFDFGSLLGVHERSPTALIPAAIGGILTICGFMSMNDRLRKHVMHLAAMVGLVGFVGALWRPIWVWTHTGELNLSAIPVRLQLATATLCMLFVILCVNSFIQARRRRRATAG